MDAARVASALDELGSLLELRGENPFRCRAYHNAADAVRRLQGADLADRLARGTLDEVPGIGAAMLAKIARLVTTGDLPELDALRQETPAGLHRLLRVPGLGPSKIALLRETLGIGGLDDLRAAAEDGRLAGVKGFGPRTRAKILDGIAFVERSRDQALQSTARRRVAPLVEALAREPGTLAVEVAGDLRRRAETVARVAVVVATGTAGEVPPDAAVELAPGVAAHVVRVPADRLGVAMLEHTGPPAFWEELVDRARSRGLGLSGAGLVGPGGPIAAPTEAAVLDALGLADIPPELRDEPGVVARAAAGELPRLVGLADLTGTFHCHTDWSDGADTLEAMAEAARGAGLAYLGIADHSRSAGYAGGLSVERVREQWRAIDALNARFGGTFRLYRGTECDILADGTLDFPDELLDGFDYVVASVHSHFGLDRGAMTARLVRAVSHPRVTMLGHPTGRLLLARDAYALDLEAVIDAAARAGTLVEINANPHRLDVDAGAARYARDRGVGIAINPDAHAVGGLRDLDYGVGQARRAGLRPEDVFNAAPAAEVAERLAALRRR
jgi:DNA polymerase (family 10)